MARAGYVVAGVVAMSAALAPGWAPAAQTNAPEAAKTPVKLERVADGLKNPWGLQFLPDGRMIVTEKAGQIRIVGTDGKLSAPLAGVPKVMADGQGGLLDIALAPDFAESGRLFIAYSEPREGGANGTSVARARLVLEGDGRLEDLKVIFQQTPSYKSSYHFGSRIVFGRDGTLFITTGDRYALKDEAQDPSNHIGKVIHITQDGEPVAGAPVKPGWDAKVWSMGHRNIQGATLDPESGQLWTIEHGARGGDELNKPETGKNYGWPVITYGIDYSGAKIGEGKEKPGLEQPVYYWDPSIAVSGLVLYSGELFPEWKGNFLVGSLKRGMVQRLVMKDGAVVEQEAIEAGIDQRVRDVRQGPDGALYLLTDENPGSVLKLVPGK